MNFCWVTLNVGNLENSLSFYHDLLGVPVASRFGAGPGTEIAMLGEPDGAKVELICDRRGGPKAPVPSVSVGFRVELLDKALDLVQSKGLEAKGPFSPAPGTRFLFISDPDGYTVQLVESDH